MAERILVPQAACAGIDLDGRRYHAKNGVMTVDNPAHAKQMLNTLECFKPSTKPVGADGFVCTTCGFHAYFRRCGRCGGTAVRPHELTTHEQESPDGTSTQAPGH